MEHLYTWFFALSGIVLSAVAYHFYHRASRLQTALTEEREERRRSLQQAEDARRKLESDTGRLQVEYEALMDRCNAGILILDPNGYIERANLTAHQLFRAPLFSMRGRTLLQVTLSKEILKLFRQTQLEDSSQKGEVRLSGMDGSILIVSISPLPLLPSETLTSRYILVAQDVTELRRLERIRQDFVANVSHELRTPLASIRAMAETLQDGALSDPTVADRFLSTIIAEALRLTRISDDLLVLSDAETQMPEKTAINLSEMIQEVVSRFEPQAQKAGVHLYTRIPERLVVLGNPDQMEQVLVNLVDNAIKYTPAEGQVMIEGEQGDESVVVHVRDTGIGIMREHLPRIFERFYRVDKARSRQSGGTGLGLSIVKNIVESHGGLVTVESEYNRGSTFSFSLPAYSEEAVRKPVSCQNIEGSEETDR
jgi:two-component system phosphate regulon sensor histidine kinase PhoR